MRGEPFRFGGLLKSGPLPDRINFPLIKGEDRTKFTAAFSGDTQTYDNLQVGYLRDTLVHRCINPHKGIDNRQLFKYPSLGSNPTKHKDTLKKWRNIVSI